MTVESLSIYAQFAGDGSTTSFPFAFPVQLPVDLVVIYTAAAGATPVYYQYPFFNVTLSAGDPAPGGVVSFQPSGGVPAPVGSIVTIARYVQPLQSVEINDQDGWYPSVVTDEFDRLCMVDQQLTDAASRAISIPADDSSTGSMTLPAAAQRALTLVGFDANGNVIVVGTGVPGGGGGAGNVISLGIQKIVAAGLLTGGTIVSTGTIALAAPPAGLVLSTGSSLTSLAIGSGLNSSGGTLTATGGASVPAAGLVSSNGSSLVATGLGAGLVLASGTLALTIAPPAAGLVLSTGTAFQDAVIGTGLTLNAGTLSASGATVPAAGLISSNGSALEDTAFAGGAAWSAGTLTAGAPVSISNGTVTASTLQTLSIGAGMTLTVAGSTGATLSAGSSGGGFVPGPIVGVAASTPPLISTFSTLTHSSNTTTMTLSQVTSGPAQFNLPLQGNGVGLSCALQSNSGTFDVKALVEITPFLANNNPQPFMGIVFVGTSNTVVLGFGGNGNTENELQLRTYDDATLSNQTTYQNIGCTTRTCWLRGQCTGGPSGSINLYISTNGIKWLLIDSLASSYFGGSCTAVGVGMDTYAYYAGWAGINELTAEIDVWHWSVT